MAKKRAFLQVPPGWDKMTEEQRRAASTKMAEDLQAQLRPKAEPKAD